MKLLKLQKNWKSQNRSGTIRKKTSKTTSDPTKLIEMRNPQVGDHQDSYVVFLDFFTLSQGKTFNLPQGSILGGTASQQKNMMFLSNQPTFPMLHPQKNSSHSDQQFTSSKCNGKWEMSTMNH